MKRAATASISSPLRTITWPARMTWNDVESGGGGGFAASQRLAAVGMQVRPNVGDQQFLERGALAPLDVEPAPALGLDHLARLLGIAEIAIEVELQHLLRARQVAQHDPVVVVLQQLGLARDHALAQDLADHTLETLLQIGREPVTPQHLQLRRRHSELRAGEQCVERRGGLGLALVRQRRASDLEELRQFVFASARGVGLEVVQVENRRAGFVPLLPRGILVLPQQVPVGDPGPQRDLARADP